MRTSILLDDELGERLRDEARRRGQSLSAFLAAAGRAALGQEAERESPPFRLIVFHGDGVHPGVDLDRSNEQLEADDQIRYSS